MNRRPSKTRSAATACVRLTHGSGVDPNQSTIGEGAQLFSVGSPEPQQPCHNTRRAPMSDETTTQPAASVEPTPKATETSVSYDRFSAVNDARREAEAQIAELRAQLEQVVPIFDKVEQLSQALQAERTERQTVEVLAHHGIGDADLRELVRWCYDRLPDDGRPTFGDAVASWRNDPEAAPLALRPHLRAPSAPAPACAWRRRATPTPAAGRSPRGAAAAPGRGARSVRSSRETRPRG